MISGWQRSHSPHGLTWFSAFAWLVSYSGSAATVLVSSQLQRTLHTTFTNGNSSSTWVVFRNRTSHFTMRSTNRPFLGGASVLKTYLQRHWNNGETANKPSAHLEIRRHEGVVYHEKNIFMLMYDICTGLDVKDLQHGVGGCFNPDELQ